jgi:hypothetical protein
MGVDDTVLYEDFLAARSEAVALTDAYREVPSDDPARPLIWDRVVRQTETARQLLERWLSRQNGTPARTGRPRELSAVR